MRLLLYAALAASCLFRTSVAAETFVSAWAPKSGDRSVLAVEKCQQRPSDAAPVCGRLTYTEEVLSADNAGLRLRYTVRQNDPAAAAFNDALPPLVVEAEPDGAPRKIVNRTEYFAALTKLMSGGDPQRAEQALAHFQAVDDATIAASTLKDVAGLALFQGVELEVGKPTTWTQDVAVPIAPGTTVPLVRTLTIDRVDGAKARAYGSYRQAYEPAALERAVESAMRRTNPGADRASVGRAEATLQNSTEMEAEIDLATGRVLELKSTLTVQTPEGAARQTLRVTRRIAD